MYGLDLINGEVRDNRQAGVLEPTISKIKSLKSALEAATSLLRIDDSITVGESWVRQCRASRLMSDRCNLLLQHPSKRKTRTGIRSSDTRSSTPPKDDRTSRKLTTSSHLLHCLVLTFLMSCKPMI